MTLEFLITSLIVVLIPGTGAIYTVSIGISQGKRASAYAAFGCTLGILPHLLATVLGLATIMHTSALAFDILRYAGVMYLLYVAWATFKDKSTFAVAHEETRSSALELVVTAVLLNLLNPKLTIFFLAFLPQFVDPDAASWLKSMGVLSSVFMGLTFVVFLLYGFAANAFRRRVIESVRVQRGLRLGFSGAFAGLGVNLAFSRNADLP